MRFRTTLILALILTLGILGVVYMNKKDTSDQAEKSANEKIINYSGDEITAIGIWPAGFQAARDSSGWSMQAPLRIRGDKNAWNAIASMFSWAKKERIVSSSPTDYPAFGLLPPRAILVLQSKGKIDTLYIGDDAAIGSLVYARKAGYPEVFLGTSSLWSNLNKSLMDLRDKSVLDFEQNTISTMEIKSGQEMFNLNKEGSDWKITFPGTYPADRNKISALLNSLQYQKAARFVEENPRSLGVYGLDKPLMQYTLGRSTASGPLALAIGKAEGHEFYARDISRPAVFIVDSSFVKSLKVTLNDLRDKQLLRFPVSAADGLELSIGDTTFVCQKDTAGRWTLTRPAAKRLRDWKITGLVSDLANATAERFVSDNATALKPFGLDKPRIRCRVTQKGALLGELLLGQDKDTTTLYAKTGTGPALYLVKRTLFEKFNVKSTDLVDSNPAGSAAKEP
ncbi:MAG TPA: DUF4340 domain-containing protein [bacterium]|nr:DUF4340 domain-containing protein [bacterium]